MPPEEVNPFAITAAPWWQRLWADDGAKYAPKRYARLAALVGPLLAFGIVTEHRVGAFAVVIALTAVPPMLVETWFRRRHRRRGEQLLAPGGYEARSAFGAAAGPVHGDGRDGQ